MNIITQSTSNKQLEVNLVFTSKANETSNKLTIPGCKTLNLDPIQNSFKEQAFSAEKGETCFFRSSNSKEQTHTLALGLGDGKKLSHEDFRSLGGKALKSLKAQKAHVAEINVENFDSYTKDLKKSVQAFAEGFELADYSFDKYKTASKSKNKSIELNFLTNKKSVTNSLGKALQEAKVLVECVNFSRQLGDTPGNLMTPEILAKTTMNEAKGTKLKVTAWDRARIKKEKMGGLLGVSLGSAVDPRFIILEYKGAAASKKPVCFVGKGLTFDCGGISIKPSANMDEMKYDMCGGANVIGTMLAIAKLGLKINAVAYVPASENMPGPLANKPGDILTARNGKTVEVLNTDAEGRLILMDALSYASEKKPAAIIDAATLTGAMVVALSNIHTGYFTKDDKLAQKVESAADESGELVWRMPLHEEHLKDMKGNHADLQNIGATRGAGSSTAAAFLSEFVKEDIPWAHFDIAGTGWSTSNRLSYAPSKAASGVMIRTFVELARKF